MSFLQPITNSYLIKKVLSSSPCQKLDAISRMEARTGMPQKRAWKLLASPSFLFSPQVFIPSYSSQLIVLSFKLVVFKLVVFKHGTLGNSLMVQGLSTFTAVAQVKSLAGELRSCNPHAMAKKKRGRGQFFTPQFPCL